MYDQCSGVTRHSEHVGRSAQGTYPQVRTAHFIKNGLQQQAIMLLFFSRSRRKLTVESSFSSFASSLTAPACLNVARILPSFFGTVFQRVQFFTGNINGFNDWGSPTLFIKLNMRIIWVTLLCAWREGKWRCRSDSVQNTSYSGEVEIGCVKLAVHLRVEFEKHPAVAIPNILISRSGEVQDKSNTIITVCRIIPFCRSEM